MSEAGFSAAWLRQREPFDLAARSTPLALGFREALLARRGTAPLHLVDLAAGSGANFRALAPTLRADQDWLLIDHDPSLLAAQRGEIARWAAQRGWHCLVAGAADPASDVPLLRIDTGEAHWQVRARRLDLAGRLEDIDLTSCDGLVTTAFLDLVSAAWLDRLCAMLARTPRPLLATLTVDGRREWLPRHPEDPFITHAFLSHQGGDKGFGASLGVDAAARLAGLLAAQGCHVRTEASDWRIGSAHGEMLSTLAREAAAVALETAPARAGAVSAWLAARSAGIAQDRVSLAVGHQDLLAIPSA